MKVEDVGMPLQHFAEVGRHTIRLRDGDTQGRQQVMRPAPQVGNESGDVIGFRYRVRRCTVKGPLLAVGDSCGGGCNGLPLTAD
eukprot:scaffold129_cov66-Phaeocystis_antarctica.AAC.1